jgi:hypothetical protein
MKKITTLYISLIFISIIVFSCKKDRGEPENLIGSWKEVDIERKITFNRDKSFSLVVTRTDGVKSTISGSYEVKGERLEFKLEPGLETYLHTDENTIQEPKLFEQATFKINGDTLTINYSISAADALVFTTAKFQKQ